MEPGVTMTARQIKAREDDERSRIGELSVHVLAGAVVVAKIEQARRELRPVTLSYDECGALVKLLKIMAFEATGEGTQRT